MKLERLAATAPKSSAEQASTLDAPQRGTGAGMLRPGPQAPPATSSWVPAAKTTPLPKPPFYGEGTQHNLVFVISNDRVRPHLPASFSLATEGLGVTPLLVIAARCDRGESLGSHRASPSYDELSYAVPVRWTTESGTRYGLHFLKLYPDAQEPVDIGVQTYGFAKELGTTTIAHAGAKLSWSTHNSQGSEVATLSIEPKRSLGSRVLGACIGFGYRLWSALAGPLDVLLVKDGTAQRTEIDAKAQRALVLEVQELRLSELEHMAILRPGQRPLLAFSLAGMRGTLSAPKQA